MPSSAYRKKLQEDDPAKYAELLRKDRERKRANRKVEIKRKNEGKQHKKTSRIGPPTLKEMQERERLKELNRIRVKRFREKKAAQREQSEGCVRTKKTYIPCTTERKSLKGLTTEELRRHRAQQRRQQRQNYSAQKQRRVKEKKRAYMRKRREEECQKNNPQIQTPTSRSLPKDKSIKVTSVGGKQPSLLEYTKVNSIDDIADSFVLFSRNVY